MSPRNSTEIGQRRVYTWRGRKLPSVTTLLKSWPQEWAISYGAKAVAERVMSPEFEYRYKSGEDSDSLTAWIKKAPHERRDAAGDHGGNVHLYLEQRLTGAIGPVPAREPYSAYHAVEAFLDAYRPDPIFVETQVFALADNYAGSFDAIINIYGRRLILDLKTATTYDPLVKNPSKAGGDHKDRLQLAAYRYADFIGEDDEIVSPLPQMDGALILAIPREHPSAWRPIEVQAGPHEHAMFLTFARAWRHYDEVKDSPIGEHLLPQAEVA